MERGVMPRIYWTHTRSPLPRGIVAKSILESLDSIIAESTKGIPEESIAEVKDEYPEHSIGFDKKVNTIVQNILDKHKGEPVLLIQHTEGYFGERENLYIGKLHGFEFKEDGIHSAKILTDKQLYAQNGWEPKEGPIEIHALSGRSSILVGEEILQYFSGEFSSKVEKLLNKGKINNLYFDAIDLLALPIDKKISGLHETYKSERRTNLLNEIENLNKKREAHDKNINNWMKSVGNTGIDEVCAVLNSGPSREEVKRIDSAICSIIDKCMMFNLHKDSSITLLNGRIPVHADEYIKSMYALVYKEPRQ